MYFFIICVIDRFFGFILEITFLKFWFGILCLEEKVVMRFFFFKFIKNDIFFFDLC